MRIAIDVSSIVYETGVSYYTRNLVDALLQLDKEDDFVLFGGSMRRYAELMRVCSNYMSTGQAVRGNSAARVFPIPPTLAHVLWNKLHILSIENLVGSVDVFHSSDWAQPPSRAFKVTTIHDLVPLKFPEISHPGVVAAHRARLKWVVKEVDRIIAVSTFTRNEIVELLGVSPEMVVVIPEAAEAIFKPATSRQIDEVKQKYNLRGDYLLVVGTDPRKNVPVVVQAFGRIKKSMPELQLVVVGRQWGQIPQPRGVIYLGHIARENLPALYSGAQALVYASIYEGFGLPVLEAMQTGCPVVTSNISSMPEVAADAAVLVDPLNPAEIARGIEEVLADREKWIKKGKARAKEFSWEYTAKLTLRVYREALR